MTAIRICTVLSAVGLLAAGLAAQQGGNQRDLALTTGVNGATATLADKPIAGNDLLTLHVTSPGATLTGRPVIIGAELVANGASICVPLPGEPCPLNLSPALFILVDGFAWPLGFTVDFSGNVVVPNNAAIFTAAQHEAVRLQAATTDPAAPNGIAFTNFIDHHVRSFTYPLVLGDDTAAEVGLQGGSFPFYTGVYTSVWVNSNGLLSFGGPQTTYSLTEALFLSGQPAIAPLWTDLNPGQGGSVVATLHRLPGGALDSLVVAWTGVPHYFNGPGLNTFDAVLHGSGDIDLSWTLLNPNASSPATDIVGLSPGGGLSLPNPLDLTMSGPVSGLANQALYEAGNNAGCTDVRDLEGGAASFTYDLVSAYAYDGGSGFTAAITGLSPITGGDGGGTLVTLQGRNLDNTRTYTVEFSAGAPATGVAVTGPCSITCTTPAHAQGPVDVIVTDTFSATVWTLPAAFTFTEVPLSAGTFSGATLGDDGSVFYALAAGTVNFYGAAYTGFHVNANGSLTFGISSGIYNETESAMSTGPARVALFFDDMHPGVGGTVTWFETAAYVRIAFTNVPAYTTGSNSGSVTIDKGTGEITLAYGPNNNSYNNPGTARSVICGVSAGGAGTTLVPVDLGTNSGAACGPTQALFEWFNTASFSGGLRPWDLNGMTFGFTPSGGGYLHHNP